MPRTPCAMRLVPTNQDLTVDITTPSGARPTVYTAENGSTSHLLPVSVTSTTDFWFTNPGDFVLSALIDGTEIASQAGTTKKFSVTSGNVTVVDAGADLNELLEGILGASGLGTAATEDTTVTGEASKIPIFEADADLTFSDGVISSGAFAGGVLRNVSGLELKNSYTQTQDWDAVTGISAGTPIYVDWNPILDYASPNPQGGWFGPRGVIAIEGMIRADQNPPVGGPLGYGVSDQMLVTNESGTAISRLLPGYPFMAQRNIVANNASCTVPVGDWAEGPVGFAESAVFATAGTGALTIGSYLSHYCLPYVLSGATMTKWVAYGAGDINDYANGNYGDIVATAMNNRYGITTDSGFGTVTEQVHFESLRATNATNNYSARFNNAVRLFDDTVTFTAAPPTMLNTTGTYTINYATGQGPTGWSFAPTLKYQQDALNFGLALPASNSFLLAPVIENESATANVDLRYVSAFTWIPTVRANTQTTTTCDAITGFYSQPTVDRSNSGAITVTNVYGAVSAGTVNTGNTVTTATGYNVTNWGGSGTLTTQIGLDVTALTKGATNIGVRNASPTVFTPSSVQTLAAGTAVLANATLVMIGTSGAVTTTAAPTIANGQDGQILTILNTAGTSWTIQDQGTLANSNVRLVGTNMVMGPRDSITLVYSSTIGDWVEIARSNVT